MLRYLAIVAVMSCRSRLHQGLYMRFERLSHNLILEEISTQRSSRILQSRSSSIMVPFQSNLVLWVAIGRYLLPSGRLCAHEIGEMCVRLDRSQMHSSLCIYMYTLRFSAFQSAAPWYLLGRTGFQSPGPEGAHARSSPGKKVAWSSYQQALL